MICGNIYLKSFRCPFLLINGFVRNFAYDAIGIEMDGANLFAQNQHITIHTITVKAVCDFGDGKNISDVQYSRYTVSVSKHCVVMIRYSIMI